MLSRLPEPAAVPSRPGHSGTSSGWAKQSFICGETMPKEVVPSSPAAEAVGTTNAARAMRAARAVDRPLPLRNVMLPPCQVRRCFACHGCSALSHHHCGPGSDPRPATFRRRDDPVSFTVSVGGKVRNAVARSQMGRGGAECRMNVPHRSGRGLHRERADAVSPAVAGFKSAAAARLPG